jgi:POT family proton-dependent oligopeptide transporter
MIIHQNTMTDAASTVKVHEDNSNHRNNAGIDALPPGVETSTLRRVPDRIPWVVLLILIVELGERFTYFGLSAPIQNYIKYVPQT